MKSSSLAQIAMDALDKLFTTQGYETFSSQFTIEVLPLMHTQAFYGKRKFNKTSNLLYLGIYDPQNKKICFDINIINKVFNISVEPIELDNVTFRYPQVVTDVCNTYLQRDIMQNNCCNIWGIIDNPIELFHYICRFEDIIEHNSLSDLKLLTSDMFTDDDIAQFILLNQNVKEFFSYMYNVDDNPKSNHIAFRYTIKPFIALGFIAKLNSSRDAKYFRELFRTLHEINTDKIELTFSLENSLKITIETTTDRIIKAIIISFLTDKALDLDEIIEPYKDKINIKNHKDLLGTDIEIRMIKPSESNEDTKVYESINNMWF